MSSTSVKTTREIARELAGENFVVYSPNTWFQVVRVGNEPQTWQNFHYVLIGAPSMEEA